MATSPFTRKNSFCPGTSGYHYYGSHDYEHLFTWTPGTTAPGQVGTPFQNSSVAILIHGGLGQGQGNSGLAIDHPSGAGLGTLLHALNIPLVSIEYPPCASNLLPRTEVTNMALWPHQLYSVGRAISYIASNADAADTEFGEALWGPGNSIDPAKIVLIGPSFGGTLALLLALLPDGWIPVGGSTPLSFSNYASDFVPRPLAVVASGAQIDWTQFSMEPGSTPELGDVYKDNIHQVFISTNMNMVWGKQYDVSGTPTNPSGQVPKRIKQDASPWWWLKKKPPHAKNTAIYLEGASVATGVKGDSLTPEDWNPGSQRLDEAAAKAFYDPHHPFQYKPTAAEMLAQGITVRTVWGTNTTNPEGGDITSWNVNRTTVNAAYPVDGLAGDQRDWLLNTVGIA